MATLDATVLTDIVGNLTNDDLALKILNAACTRITAHGYLINRIPSGSTSKTVKDNELGWIQTVAISIYAKDYKQGGANNKSEGTGQLSQVTSASDPDVLAEQAAEKLLIENNDYSQAFI